MEVEGLWLRSGLPPRVWASDRPRSGSPGRDCCGHCDLSPTRGHLPLGCGCAKKTCLVRPHSLRIGSQMLMLGPSPQVPGDPSKGQYALMAQNSACPARLPLRPFLLFPADLPRLQAGLPPLMSISSLLPPLLDPPASAYSLPLGFHLFQISFIFLKKIFYLFVRDTERERQRHRQRAALVAQRFGAACTLGCDPGDLILSPTSGSLHGACFSLSLCLCLCLSLCVYE